jgi:hypothetical protein
MPRTPDPAAMTAAYKQGMASAGGKWLKGIMATTVNPAALAKAKVDDGTWAANTTAAASRLSAALGGVSQQFWQAQAQAAQGQYTGSAQKAGNKYSAKASMLAAAAAAGSAAAHAVPKSDPIGRVRANINAFKQAVGKPTI